MRNSILRGAVGLCAALALVPFMLVSAQQGRGGGRGAETPRPPVVDPHNLDGMWASGDAPQGYRQDDVQPEPPLTDWAKQHLLMKSISHDAYAGKHIPGWDRPGHICPNNNDPCFSEDLYGVKANDPNGEYPAKDCEPLSSPAIYDYPGIGNMEILTPRIGGDRIFQMFEYHREWRTFFLKRDHPKDIDQTFEGDSVAHWEGNTLVVDTTGYNGKTMITQKVGHWKSEDFRLVERMKLLDQNHLVIEMTYVDPKAWGDKTWTGFKRYYKRAALDDFQEFICSPREYQDYEANITKTFNDGK